MAIKFLPGRPAYNSTAEVEKAMTELIGADKTEAILGNIHGALTAAFAIIEKIDAPTEANVNLILSKALQLGVEKSGADGLIPDDFPLAIGLNIDWAVVEGLKVALVELAANPTAGTADLPDYDYARQRVEQPPLIPTLPIDEY